ncbi:MAG TPA: O-antigen ligase family protein [Verrucomicrobiae bacterium]|nr:O-antigen ligase family protein [Verrucomicrobiae bacterium]
MNREKLDRLCQRGILGLVLAILIFSPLAMGAVDAWAFLIVQALTIGVMLLWLLRTWLTPKPQLLWPPICWAVLAFAIYAVARYLTADIEYVARQEMIQVFICGFLFFAIINNLHRQEFSQVISFTLVFLAMGISCYAAFQFLTHSKYVWNYETFYPGRGSGTYISPDNFACFLEMLVPLAVAYTLVGRMKPVLRILLGYAVLVMLVGIAVTFSRGGWVAVTAALLVLLGVLIFHPHHRLPAFLLLVVLIAGGTLFVTKYLSRTFNYVARVEQPLQATPSSSLDMRRDLWIAAVEMWRDNFWFGVGPAHYNYRFREYRSVYVQLTPDRAHNDYLNLLADWGTVGGIIVLAGMAAFAAGLLQTRRYLRRSEKDLGSGRSNRLAFFLGATAGLFALAIHSAVDFNLHIPANAILGVTLLALLSSNVRFASENYWLRLRSPLKILATVVLVAGIVYLGWQDWRRKNENFWLMRADALNTLQPDYLPARAAMLEKAFAAEPENFETAYDIGECYRKESFIGGQDNETLANTAMQWYQRGWQLDRYEGYDYLGYGMCLDWLSQAGESQKYFTAAAALDPNGYFTAANIGWHYFQTGDYAAARTWLERSLELQWNENLIAHSYLDLAKRKLTEDASGQKMPFPPGF